MQRFPSYKTARSRSCLSRDSPLRDQGCQNRLRPRGRNRFWQLINIILSRRTREALPYLNLRAFETFALRALNSIHFRVTRQVGSTQSCGVTSCTVYPIARNYGGFRDGRAGPPATSIRHPRIRFSYQQSGIANPDCSSKLTTRRVVLFPMGISGITRRAPRCVLPSSKIPFDPTIFEST